jgi:gamma-glutamylcyclotransferase (GGCT)/AIG2-like uncharacterized protein YtfP
MWTWCPAPPVRLKTKGTNIMLQATYETVTPKKEVFFLYGTLKQGHRNHDIILQSKARLLMRVTKLVDISLVEVMNGIPGAIYESGGELHGELWELQEPNISMLKTFEQQYSLTTVKLPSVYEITDIRTFSIFMWPGGYGYRKKLGVANWTIEMENQSYERGL